MTKKNITNFEAVRAIFDKRTAKFFGDIQSVERYVDEWIHENTQAIIQAAIGIDTRYNEVRLTDKSPLHKFVSEKAKISAEKWIEDKISGDFMPELNANGKKQIEAAYREEYFETLYDAVREAAKARAQADLKEIVSQLAKIDTATLKSKPSHTSFGDGLGNFSDDAEGDDPTEGFFTVSQPKKGK